LLLGQQPKGVWGTGGRTIWDEGAAVVIVDKVAVPRTRFSEDEGWEGLKSVVAEVEATGGKALAVVADISNHQEVGAAVAKALERFGKIDMLVHCAAIRGPMTTPLVKLSEGDWRTILDVNLTGAFSFLQRWPRV